MGQKRRERGVKAGRCWVHARGGADQPESCQSLPVGDQEGDRWEAGPHREYPGGRSREAVCDPPLDLTPERIEARCRSHAGCEQVRAVE